MKNLYQKIILKAKKNIFGQFSGNNLSKTLGDGFDFSELKEYVYGDDARKIDWKRSANTGKLHVRLFNEQRQINVLIVPILSGSLCFGTKEFKQETLSYLVALLGFSALKNNDLYAIITCKNSTIQATKLNKQQYILHANIKNLLSENLLGIDVNYDQAVKYINDNFKKRSMIIFISDFYAIPNFSTLSSKHEVVAIALRDRFEEDPKALGYFNHIDPNTLKTQNLFMDKSMTNTIKTHINLHDKKLFNAFIKQKIRARKIYTDDNIYEKMHEFLGV